MSGSYEAPGEPGPPPAPFERSGIATPAPTLAPAPASSHPSRVRLLPAVVISGVIGLAAGFVLAGALEDVELPWRDAAAVQSARDAELVVLLEGIVGSESIMLDFNDELTELFEEATDEATALAAIAAAASAGEEGLRAARPDLLESVGDPLVDGVRDEYIPHLDSWIEYLAAIAFRPELLFLQDDQQPYILRINATAEAFGDALEELLVSDPAPAVAELAEGILEAGFRSEREADV